MAQDILLVDDNESVVTALGDYLQELGYRVDRSTDGSQARDMLLRRDYTVAILDLELPSVSGEELFRLARAKERPPEIIFITGDAQVGTAATLLSEGAFDYLVKPFDEKTLEKSVRVAATRQEAAIRRDSVIRQLMGKTRQLEGLVKEQEMRIAELDSSRRAANDVVVRTQSLSQDLDKLTRLVEAKDQELQACRHEHSESLAQREQRLAKLEKVAGLARPSRLLTGVLYLCLGLGVAAGFLGILGGRFRSALPDVADHEVALLVHAFLLSVIAFSGMALQRLRVLQQYFRTAPEDVEQEPPSRRERVLAALGRFALVGALTLLVVAGWLARAAAMGGRAPASVAFDLRLVLNYLGALPARHWVELCLGGAGLLLLWAATAVVVLLVVEYNRVLKESVQKSSARKRLETL